MRGRGERKRRSEGEIRGKGRQKLVIREGGSERGEG